MSKQEETQFIDILWLKTFGLHKGNVLDYFYTSPFFDVTSNNQQIRIQNLGVEFLIGMVGIEYVVDENNTFEPALFVIKKQKRLHATSVVLLDIFYCLDGIIYQSPTLLDLLRSRTAKASLHLERAFNTLQSLKNKSKSTQTQEIEFNLTQRSLPIKIKKILTTKSPHQELPSFNSTMTDLSFF